ncbi:MAG: alanine dehydrogenase [Armatimonadetes bacterium]|nr:alanine dehydrogenase [Armatimonadota bacterium]
MIVGVPREIKDGEERVAMSPAGVRAFCEHGHRVLVQAQAGAGCRVSDDEYRKAGAQVVQSAEGVYRRSEMMLKVKEPLPPEYDLLRPGQILFTYLHLASSRDLVRALLERDVVGLGYETVQTPDGALPLLVPMSEIAGKMSIQVGARLLEAEAGGRGTLLGGVPGVPPAEVVIIGCGVVGTNAAKVAIGMGAHVTILDINHDRLKYLDDVLGGRVITVYANAYSIERAAGYADLLIGAVLLPGAKAPKLVTRSMVRQMKSGAGIVDVAVDQGGCVETIQPTSHSQPTYLKYGVVHYGVPNIPAAVPRSATHALTNATLPWALEVADKGVAQAVATNQALARGVNVARGAVVHPAVAAAFGMKATQLSDVGFAEA